MSYKHWLIKVNKKKCSICEVCSLRCPTGAIKLKRVSKFDELLFYFRQCNGCDGKPYCKEHCPEQAISIRRVGRCPPSTISLVKARAMICSGCGARFAAQKKFDKVLQKPDIIKKEIHLYCPDCRRRMLIQTCLSR
jgi:Pyruvate/2-oxoacid:ferredoxin oxidoreductase delta subunit